MKRRIALFLALVMIVSLLPMNVFAKSSNSVDRIPKVDDEYAGWVAVDDGRQQTSRNQLNTQQRRQSNHEKVHNTA